MIFKKFTHNLKKSLLLLAVPLFVVLPLGALELELNSIEPFVQASGIKKGKIYFFKVDRVTYEQVNMGRKISGRIIYPLEQVMGEPGRNREYAMDILRMHNSDLREEIKKEPTADQLFLYAVMGKKAFGKINWDPDSLEDEDVLVRLELFRKNWQDMQGVFRSMPPLPRPTNWPARYYPPQPSEHR